MLGKLTKERGVSELGKVPLGEKLFEPRTLCQVVIWTLCVRGMLGMEP